MDATATVERLRKELHALDRAYSPGHHGLWSARRRAELFDAALAELFAAAGALPGVALIALGGYGRMQQLPRSDLDLLILHASADPGHVAALAERLFYPLWDAGFEIGHAVRTVDECGAIAADRLDALTAMLDLRPLAGDAALAEVTKDVVVSIAAADPRAFASSLRDDGRERADRVGSAAHLLEPDLKSGAGGLRDIRSMSWLGAAWPSSLEEMGVLRAAERASLSEAEDFLTRVRSALHLETSKRVDRLPLESQPPIARAMGFADEPRLIAEDGLMRAVFEHARAVRWITDNVWARVFAGEEIASEVPAIADPAGVLGALAAEAEATRPPSPELLDAIQACPMPEVVAWTPAVREAFLRILRTGEAGVGALDTLDRLDLLVRFIPEWTDVRCRPQRDPYHRLTVDAHLTTSLAEMARMLRPGTTSDRAPADEMVKHIDDSDGLLLGALFHDIGKVGEGSHVPRGAAITAEILTRMRVDDATKDLATFLVTEHLLLPDTATRRDLTDENLILDVAATVGSTRRLAALTLLAEADALATGPTAWTPWRQTLLRELATRVQRTLDRGDMGTELAERLAAQIDHLRDLLEAEPEEAVQRFVLAMPRGYFLSVEPAAAARHFSTIAPDVGTNEVRSAAVVGTRAGTYELLVVAADRPGLLSWIAGSLALAGLSILTAQVFTTDDGVAVDLFEVEGIFEPDIVEARWREFRRTLRKAVEGRTSLAHRVVEKRRLYPSPSVGTPVTVVVDNEASDYSTVIEVGAPDRIGLLYDITSALADLRLDVRLAKVATYTGRVVDSFYVRDPLGGKVVDTAQISEIETAVRARAAD